MKIPSRVVIRGRPWTVERVPVVIDDEGEPTEEDVGYCSWQRHLIQIRDDVSEQEALETFLHECLHAIIPAGLLSVRVEEIVCANSDEGLADCVRALVEEAP